MLKLALLPLLLLLIGARVDGQSKRQMHKGEKSTVTAAESVSSVELLGIRPGIMIDSVIRVIQAAGATFHEVPQDSLTNCVADNSIRIYVVDSIICRLAWMRMTFLSDAATHRVKRFSITPRVSSIAAGVSDDINAVLLLYFGQRWGKPEIRFEPPACFLWRIGNTDVRGYIRRGYALWVMEG